MNIHVKDINNVTIIELKGKLEGGPLSSVISKNLHDLLEKGKKNVVIDLGNVSYISSSGLGILISGLASMKNGGGTLKLANISNKVEGLLSITKLNQIFEKFDTVDQAVESFK